MLALQDASAGETIAWLYDATSNWLNDREGKPPREIENVSLVIPVAQGEKFDAIWWDTRAGVVLRTDHVSAADGSIHLKTPKFVRDIALRIVAASAR